LLDIAQALNTMETLWERACSRKRCPTRWKCGGRYSLREQARSHRDGWCTWYRTHHGAGFCV